MLAKLKEENKRRDREQKEWEEREKLKQKEKTSVIVEAAKKAGKIKEASRATGENETGNLNDGLYSMLIKVADKTTNSSEPVPADAV